eukprot:1185156-Prorocentrum_minimum.AAC.2
MGQTNLQRRPPPPGVDLPAGHPRDEQPSLVLSPRRRRQEGGAQHALHLEGAEFTGGADPVPRHPDGPQLGMLHAVGDELAARGEGVPHHAVHRDGALLVPARRAPGAPQGGLVT